MKDVPLRSQVPAFDSNVVATLQCVGPYFDGVRTQAAFEEITEDGRDMCSSQRYEFPVAVPNGGPGSDAGVG